jgi:hypothetical protein
MYLHAWFYLSDYSHPHGHEDCGFDFRFRNGLMMLSVFIYLLNSNPYLICHIYEEPTHTHMLLCEELFVGT